MSVFDRLVARRTRKPPLGVTARLSAHAPLQATRICVRPRNTDAAYVLGFDLPRHTRWWYVKHWIGLAND